MQTTTILLVTAIAFAGLLTAPAILETVGFDAPGADPAPGASGEALDVCVKVWDESEEIRQCAGVTGD